MVVHLSGQNREVDSLKSLIASDAHDTIKINAMVNLAYKTVYTNVHESKNTALKAIKLGEKLKRYSDVATALKVLGILHDEWGRNTESIGYYLNAITFYALVKDSLGIARCQSNIGKLYHKMGDQRKAIAQYKNCIRIFEKYQFALGINLSYQNIGISYFNMNRYDSALVYFLYAEEHLKKNNMDDESLLGNIANCYSGIGNKPKAEQYFTKCLAKFEEKKEYSAQYYFWKTNLGAVYNQEGKHSLSKKILLEALNGLKSLDLIYSDDYRKALLNMALTHAALKDYKSAYDNLIMLGKVQDSLNQEKMDRTINAVEIKFEAEKDKLRVNGLLKEKRLLLAEKKQRAFQIYLLLAAVSLVLITLAFFYIGFKRKKKDNKIIQQQKELVERKNQEVKESIEYAKRLQQAILPAISSIESEFADCFVMYLPKDIVAGDFYFMEKTPTHLIIAVADSTGHGVPGAIVSVVCSNALAQSVKEFHLSEPGAILDKTRELVIKTFEKSGENVLDGMDISLCSIPLDALRGKQKQITFQWAGAFNPLWYICDGTNTKIKANKQAVGKSYKYEPFITHNIAVNPGTVLYLFSDGLADQFGGPAKKKFRSKQVEEILLSTMHLTLREQKEVLYSGFKNWMGNLEQIDDICFIGLKL